MRAFTLVELLIVISIVALLSSMMMPAFKSARENARRVTCMSNMRQIGIGINLYVSERDDRLPASYFGLPGDECKPQEMMAASTGLMTFISDEGETVTQNRAEGLGRLIDATNSYIDNPRILYCPCHRGVHSFVANHGDGGGFPSGAFAAFTNYHYRGDLKTDGSFRRITDGAPSEVTLVADGMRSKADINHVVGANLLRCDLSVRWWKDSTFLFNEAVPQNATDQSTPEMVIRYANLWKQMDSSR
ncbi:MAG: type II secretion system protein [Phycisphaerales bacterium]|nr:type II secretion system protein [Phycisphaerales bacterium]